MPILGLLLEIGSVFFILRWLKKNLDLGLNSLSLLIQSESELFQTMEDRLKYVQDHDQDLSKSIETESAIYEVSKELSKSTDETNILNAFKEKISGPFCCKCTCGCPTGYSFHPWTGLGIPSHPPGYPSKNKIRISPESFIPPSTRLPVLADGPCDATVSSFLDSGGQLSP